MRIVTVADDGFARVIQALAKSLVYHGHELTVVAVNCMTDECFLDLIGMGCEVIFIEHEMDIKPFAHVPNTSYAKLLLPGLFPDEARILYLDGDVICTGDLSELETIDLEGHSTGGVVDSMWPLVGHNVRDEAIYNLTAMIGHDVNKPAFNGGVLLMDVQKWLVGDIGKKTLAFAADSSTRDLLLAGDQGAMAYYHRGAFKELDQKYNTSYKGRLHTITDDTRIIHWHGPMKPWNSDVKHGEIWHRYNNMEIDMGKHGKDHPKGDKKKPKPKRK